MANAPADEEAAVAAPDIDESGVDRSQIRAMLELTPEQRLKRIEEFVDSLREIRELNEQRPRR